MGWSATADSSGPVTITLPFDCQKLPRVRTDCTYNVFLPGDDPSLLRDTVFWVPPYAMSGFEAEFAAATSLRVLQAQTAGVDHLLEQLPATATLCSARGVHDAATSEMAVLLTLASLRQLPRWVAAQSERKWDHYQFADALADRTVLLVGYGGIGRAIETRLRGFECTILRVASSAREDINGPESLSDLLPLAHVVILAVPLTPDTRGMVDAHFLSLLQDRALIVNISRGAVIDSPALLAELDRGRLRAALDVTDPEPLPPGNPLWNAPNVLITPHVGGGTTAMWPRIAALIVDQIDRLASNRPLRNVVRG